MSNSVDGILQQSTKELKGAKRRSKGADRRGGERNLEKNERKKKRGNPGENGEKRRTRLPNWHLSSFSQHLLVAE